MNNMDGYECSCCGSSGSDVNSPGVFLAFFTDGSTDETSLCPACTVAHKDKIVGFFKDLGTKKPVDD